MSVESARESEVGVCARATFAWSTFSEKISRMFQMRNEVLPSWRVVAQKVGRV